MYGLLKHSQLQCLLEVGLPLPPEVLQLHLPPSDVVKETANDGHRVDLIWSHTGSPSFIMALGGAKRRRRSGGRGKGGVE